MRQIMGLKKERQIMGLVKKKVNKLVIEEYLIVVPEALREPIKTICHDGTSGHLGVLKTKDRLLRHFFWPKCYKEIEDIVKMCDPCQCVGKTNNRKKAPLVTVPVISEVFSKINVDACGPMPISTEGNKYLITVMCLATKYPDAIPVPDIASKSVVNTLLQVWHKGVPEFSVHRIVKRVLRVLCIEAAPNWESQVPAALFALRTVMHESTGFSPAELVHGSNLRTPVTLLYESWLDPEEKADTVVEHVFELINRLKKCRDLATVRMEEVRDRRKKWYDKNAIKREFQQGDAVLVLSLNQPHKLAPQWKGPGKIEKRLSETNYVGTFDGSLEGNKVYHINMLKPYHRRPELLNAVLVDTEEITESSELEEDFPYMLTDPIVFDFKEIVENNKLKE
ncbi:retrovirus-related Pol polyprotein from transposon 412 [Trichonephila clavipes]|nr:retrovirus-related Pol polyprotein from transposon 412 [Trichonephila clavipes]